MNTQQAKNDQAPDQMLTQEQAAARLGWTVEGFRKARYEGRLRGLRIYRFGHRTIRIAEADLDAFIAKLQVCA
jgi:excisionase family DNA binding protein